MFDFLKNLDLEKYKGWIIFIACVCVVFIVCLIFLIIKMIEPFSYVIYDKNAKQYVQLKDNPCGNGFDTSTTFLYFAYPNSKTRINDTTFKNSYFDPSSKTRIQYNNIVVVSRDPGSSLLALDVQDRVFDKVHFLNKAFVVKYFVQNDYRYIMFAIESFRNIDAINFINYAASHSTQETVDYYNAM
jgi:hypothetical protein